MELSLNPIENLLVTVAPMATILQTVADQASSGKTHPMGVYADPPGRKIYTSGLEHQKQLVGIVLPIAAAVAIVKAVEETKATDIGKDLMAKLAEFNGTQAAEEADA